MEELAWTKWEGLNAFVLLVLWGPFVKGMSTNVCPTLVLQRVPQIVCSLSMTTNANANLAITVVCAATDPMIIALSTSA